MSRKNGRLILQTWSSDSNFWDPLQQISGWPDHQKGKYLYLWKTIYWCVFCSIKNITIVLNFGVNKIPCDYAELRLSIWLVRWSDMNTSHFCWKLWHRPFLGWLDFVSPRPQWWRQLQFWHSQVHRSAEITIVSLVKLSNRQSVKFINQQTIVSREWCIGEAWFEWFLPNYKRWNRVRNLTISTPNSKHRIHYSHFLALDASVAGKKWLLPNQITKGICTVSY